MNNDLRNEMLVVLNSENVCDECQITVLSYATRFLNNIQYDNSLKSKLEPFFNSPNFNIWVELPKIISVVIQLNETIKSSIEMDLSYMKYVIYAVIHNYLTVNQYDLFSKVSGGDFRVCFLNTLEVLLMKPKKLSVHKQTLLQMIGSCICGDEDIIRI